MTESAEIRESFVQLWGRMGPFWGVSPTTARVYGWLLASGEGSDADTLMEALGMSRGAVSMACKELRDWGLAHPDRPSGSRRTHWRAETDLEKTIRSIVETRKRREWDPILESLREWIPELEGSDDPQEQVFLERLRAIEAIVGVADSMAVRFLKGGVLGDLGIKLLTRAAQRTAQRERRQKKKRQEKERE